MVFFVCNFVTNIALARILGVDLYGTYGVIMAINAILATMVYNGMFETVMKLVAESPDRRYAILRSSLSIQIVFCGGVLLAYLFSAGAVARALNNPGLEVLLIICAFSVLPWGISANYLGVLGGLRMFGRQAFVLALGAVLKLAAILSLVLLGFALEGAALGYAIALVPGVILAMYFCPVAKRGNGFPRARIVSFALPLAANSLIYALVTSLDLLLVQRILKNDSASGLYACASTLAKAVWILFATFGTTLLPSIARSVSEKDSDLTRRYIRQALRHLLILMAPIAFLLSGASGGIVQMLYTSRFAGAGAPLSVLVFGLSLFAVFSLMSIVITGSGRPGVSLLFGVITLGSHFVLNSILIPRYGLAGAAVATTVAFMLGTAIAATEVFRQFRTLMEPLSLVRILCCSGLLWLVARRFPMTGVSLLLELSALTVLYVLCLAVSGEIRREDLRLVGTLLGLAGTVKNNMKKRGTEEGEF